VKSKMPAYLLNTIIPRNVRLSEAPSYGKSIIYYDIKSKGAQAYLHLAQEVAVRKAI
ncbi:MAG: ParA family protein, partial [Desulfovibrio sp.]|nr:ParA family protein [Desulfovibrio sp.]